MLFETSSIYFLKPIIKQGLIIDCTVVQDLTLNSSISCSIFSKPVCKMLAIEFQSKNNSRFHKQHAVSISIISGVWTQLMFLKVRNQLFSNNS